MRLQRIYLYVGLTAVLVASLVWWRAAETTGTWVDVKRGTLTLTIDVEGVLKAASSRAFGPPPVPSMSQFKITYMAPDGSDVHEGARVLAFDASELERRLREQRAELASARKEMEKKQTAMAIRKRDDELRLAEAEGKLEKARLKLERPASLVAAKEIEHLELDRELAQEEVAHLHARRQALDEADEAELTALREYGDYAARRVRMLEDAIAKMTIRAPRDGTVIHITDRSGEKKRVGDAVWRRELVVELPDLSEMAAKGFVDEVFAGRLAAGQRVEIRLDAHPDVRYQGRLRDIGKTVQSRGRSSPVRGVPVLIELEVTDPARMLPEMRFHGTIEVERVENVLLIPLEAIRHRDGRTVVVRRTGTGSERVEVELGRRDRRQIEVRRGLVSADRVRIWGTQERET